MDLLHHYVWNRYENITQISIWHHTQCSFLIRLLFIVLEQYLKARSWRSVRFVCIYFLWSMVWFQLMEVLKWSLKYATFKFLLIKQDITFSISCTKIDTSLIPSLRIFFLGKVILLFHHNIFFFKLKKPTKQCLA